MTAWHVLSRKLCEAAAKVDAAAKASPFLPGTPSVAALSTMLRSPLTHLFAKRRLIEPTGELCQVSLVPAALPSRAQLSVLGDCEPRVLARLALTNAAWASAVVEHSSAEETWEAWAAMSPRPTLQHMQQLYVACTLRLPPSQAIEGLRLMELALSEYDAKASCFDSSKLPGSWLDYGLSGSLPELLGVVVRSSLRRACFSPDDTALVYLSFLGATSGRAAAPEDEAEAAVMGEEVELFCAAAQLGSERKCEVFVAVAARCPMDGDVTASFFGNQLLGPGAASGAEEGADGETDGAISCGEIFEISNEEVSDGLTEIDKLELTDLLTDPAVAARVRGLTEAQLAQGAASTSADLDLGSGLEA